MSTRRESPAPGAVRRRVSGITLALLVTDTALVATSCGGGDAVVPASAATTQIQASATTPVPVSAPVSVGRSAPTHVRVPAIGVDQPLIDLGLNPDQTVQVPSDAKSVGWYRLGASPGEIGSAVLLGHVDSYLGPGVFFNLKNLVPGNEIVVNRADGTTVTFRVREVREYPKSQFPAEQVYGSHGDAELALVTCGGAFDHKARSYNDNIVAYSTLVSVAPTAK